MQKPSKHDAVEMRVTRKYIGLEGHRKVGDRVTVTRSRAEQMIADEVGEYANQTVDSVDSPRAIPERAYSEAVWAIISRENTMDYTVEGMISHFSVEPEGLRAELERRVKALGGVQPKPTGPSETKPAGPGETKAPPAAPAAPAQGAEGNPSGAGTDGHSTVTASSPAPGPDLLSSSSAGALVSPDRQSGAPKGAKTPKAGHST